MIFLMENSRKDGHVLSLRILRFASRDGFYTFFLKQNAEI